MSKRFIDEHGGKTYSRSKNPEKTLGNWLSHSIKKL